MELAGGKNIIRSDQLFKVDGYQASYKEKQVKVDKMREIFFLLSADQKRHSLLLKKLKDGEKVDRGDYPVTTTSELDILIRTEGGIWVIQRYSTHENWGVRGGRHHKERTGKTFTQNKGGT